MKFIGDICYGKSEYPEQYLDIYLPDANSFKVFVYIHGGGMIGGDKSNAKIVGEYVASQGIAFVSVNYRLYPNCVSSVYLRFSRSSSLGI